MIFRGQTKIILGIFFLIAAAASLSAAGAQDTVLIQADQLIESKQYDEAVRILSDYIKTNPDKFTEAQKRLQHIVKIREQFNVIADQLLDVLVDDPSNSVRILDLSNQLVALGSASDSSTQDFLNQVRELAVFTINRNRLEQILVQARSLLDQNDFAGAMAVYAGGLDIYQADFFASGYGADAEQTARDGLAAINNSAGGFSSLAVPFGRAASAVANLASQSSPPASVRDAFQPLIPLMEQISAYRSQLVSVDDDYSAQIKLLQDKYPNLQDRSFLSFASRLIRGPADANEGMIGALDRFWDLNVASAETAAANLSNNSYSAALQSMNSGLYEDAQPLIDTAKQYLAVSQEFLDYWTIYEESSGVPAVNIYNGQVTRLKAGEFLKYNTMGKALDFFNTAADIGFREKSMEFSALDLWDQGSMDFNAAISSEQGSRLALYAAGIEAASLSDSINSEILAYQNSRDLFSGFFGNEQDPIIYLNQAKAIAANLGDLIRNQGMLAFVRQYTISNESLEAQVIQREQEFTQGSSMIQGIGRQVESAQGEQGETQVIVYYPAEGLDILTKMSQSVAANLVTGQGILAQLGSEPTETTNTNEGRTINAASASLVNRLQSLQSRSVTLMATAQTQVNQAAAFKMEGDRLYQQAQTALANNDFELARSRLDLAQSRYSDSLAIQESDSLRELRDTRLISLGADIVRLENEFVVREVRDRVTAARSAYYQGNFDEAEQQLVTALNRWRTTNSTDDPEINYWLTMTRNALSLSSGRVIPSTAPLYAEMSQLLSDARLNYQEGVRLINSGNRQDGLKRFADAKGLTQKVELMFPLNREARLLDLQIDQFTDPAGFNASFRQRINDAVAGTKPAIRSVESFADLQNLVEINPNYPGISQILTQAEIDMGYRPPPPDPKALADSDSLTQQARPIIETRNTAMYSVAQVWINQAIVLNPNNDAAIMLKDRLSILMTGTAELVMDSKSYDDYQRAVMEFQRGNKYTAWAIVQELLRNPNNQRVVQILDLQSRIESQL